MLDFVAFLACDALTCVGFVLGCLLFVCYGAPCWLGRLIDCLLGLI